MKTSHEIWFKILASCFIVVAVMCTVFALVLIKTNAKDSTESLTITDVEKTTDANVDTYTVHYSDGSSYAFTVTNAVQSDAGAGITSISKTSTSGNTDVYTIYLTDGTEYPITVNTGSDGTISGGEEWFTGTAEPAQANLTEAQSGDFYLNTVTCNVYEYDGTTWNYLCNIQGETGATGSTGADGATWYTGKYSEITSVKANSGDYFLATDTCDIYQYDGTTWSASIANIKGVTGAQGAAGADGEKWFTGTEEPENANLTEAQSGDFYLNTVTCNVYEYDGSKWTYTCNIKGAQGIQGEQGKQGIAGTDGATWYTGSDSDKSAVTASEGDLYLAIDTYDIYKYENGSWGDSIANIQGGTGSAGAAGSTWYSGTASDIDTVTAKEGDFYFATDTCDIYQYNSAWSVVANIKGEKGDTGTGTQGAAGTVWFTGEAVSKAALTATVNGAVSGDLYLNTSTSDVFTYNGTEWSYVCNIKGATGGTGSAGATGTGIKSITAVSATGDGTYGTDGEAGTLITITLTGADESGKTTYSFFVPNGSDGKDGNTGETGSTGLGIKSIEKTETSANGLTDTYTITYTNDTTSTYTVTNGDYITDVSIEKNTSSSTYTTYTYKFTMASGATKTAEVTYDPYITNIAKDDADTTALKITYSNGTYATISGVVNINAVKTLTYSNGVLTVTNTNETSYSLSLHCLNHSFKKISTLSDDAKEKLLGTDNKNLTDIEATCTSTGVTYYYCTVCGEIHSEITAAAGHKYDSSKIVQLEVTGSTELYGLKCSECELYSVVELGFKYTAYDKNGNKITETVSGTAAAQVSASGSSSASLASARLTDSENTDTTIAYYGVSRGSYIGANPVIPSTYNGYPVKQIDDFRDSKYESVTIGAITLEYEPLKSITIPDSVVYINAFVYNTKDNEYKEENSNDHAYAFQGCTKLTTVNFTGTSSLTYIGTQAFSGCTSLTSFTVPKTVIFTGNKVFEKCTYLSAVTFENGGTAELEIGENLFNGCTELKTLVIPDRTTTMKGKALAGTSITELTIPFIGHQPNTETDSKNKGYNTFYWIFNSDSDNAGSAKDVPSSLTTVTITGNCSSSDNSHTIDAGAFAGCATLTTVIIGDGITTIGAGAFSGCSSLTSITLPFVGANSTVSTATAEAMFGYIFGTASYEGGTAVNQYYTKTEGESGAEYATYYIPSTLTTVTVTGGNLKRGAFYNCTTLETVTLQSGVKALGNYSFYGCTALKSITIESSNTNITAINSSVFYGCASLTSVSLTEAITSIGNNAFRECTSLVSITIPSGVQTIGSSAFRDCTALTSVTV